jgi:hypothetical protein
MAYNIILVFAWIILAIAVIFLILSKILFIKLAFYFERKYPSKAKELKQTKTASQRWLNAQGGLAFWKLVLGGTKLNDSYIKKMISYIRLCLVFAIIFFFIAIPFLLISVSSNRFGLI